MKKKVPGNLRSVFFGTWERCFDQGRLVLPKRMRLAGMPRFWRIMVGKGRVLLKPTTRKLSKQGKNRRPAGAGGGVHEIDHRGRLFIPGPIRDSIKLGDKVLVMASRKGDYVILSRGG